MNDNIIDMNADRVRELLEAHVRNTKAGVTHSVDGVVTVTVDSQLQLTSVQLLEKSIDGKTRDVLERAIVDAVNGAMLKAVKSSADALLELQASDGWRRAMDELLKRAQPQSGAGGAL